MHGLVFDKIAIDRGARTYDKDGRLHVSLSNISKAAVNKYIGREIPKYEALGLDGNKVYSLFRDPNELAKAAHTFNNIPLLTEHKPVNAEAPRNDLIAGSIGSSAAFNAPYLTNSLAVWDRACIDRIESGEQKELSCAYYFTLRVESGEYLGEKYDGVMTNIIGNHVALVSTGRAGSDVVVSDSKTNEVEKMTMHQKIIDAITAVIKPLMLADEAPADIDEDEKNKKEDKKPEEAPAAEKSDADKKGEKVAMDAAINAAVASAEASALSKFKAIRQAEKDVQKIVGEVAVQDSAEAIYKMALDHAGVDVAGVHPSAYGAMVRMLNTEKDKIPSLKLVQDSNNEFTKFGAMFPNAVMPKRGA